MIRASTATKLSLARWAQLMGLNPLHFAGTAVPTGRTGVACGGVWPQYAWQDTDRDGRDDVAMAIREAEEQLEVQLGFRLAPSWEVDDWSYTRRPYDPTLVGLAFGDVRGYGASVEASWAYWITGGIRAAASITDGVAIAWSDVDGDNIDETGTVIVATTVDRCEIHAYATGHGGDPTWEIRPVTVTVTGGGATATITFRRELVLKDEFSEWIVEPDPRSADYTDDANFYDTVDVWRVYNDPRTQGSFLWEPTGQCGCGSTGCPNCAYATQTLCQVARNARLSVLVPSPSVWNADTLSFDALGLAVGRNPDIARLYYYAGAQDRSASCPRLTMPTQWEAVVAAFATSKLGRAPCECSGGRWDNFSEDLAVTSGPKELATYSISPSDLDNPFGTRRGAVQAWKWVSAHDLRVSQSAVVTV